MRDVEWLQLAIFLGGLILLAKPVGLHLCAVLDPKGKTFLDPFLKPLERSVYRLCRIDPLIEQDWKKYAGSLLGFSLISLIFTIFFLAAQSYFPLNPEQFKAPSWDLNINTAISFMTNTDWQSYGGESTLSYLSQMCALVVQNFLSASVGLATAAALVRGIARKGASGIGNFWSDLVRTILYLLLPISVICAILFLSEGVPQNFSSYTTAVTLEGGSQMIAQGPIASQEAIKMLGSNGGGFMNVNSAHPYENPTPFANLLQMFLILLIPVSQIYYFGRAVRNPKHAWYIIGALGVLFVLGVWICSLIESGGNPEWAGLGISGGNWEGKELRFGIFNSALYACSTTAVSCGAVNCMHDSLMPLGGFIPMLNIQLSEVIFGGVGAGLYSVLLFIFLAIFISGLIIGRTPEYLGKKIETRDIKIMVLAILPYIVIVHAFTSLASFSSWGISALGNEGPHGFSEILYAFSSCAANNGSAFAGLSTNTVAYNLSLAAATLLGRFLVIVPVIALAGSLAGKKLYPRVFPVASPLFISLLIGVILLLGVLTFLPALTMGPILEHFLMLKRILFP